MNQNLEQFIDLLEEQRQMLARHVQEARETTYDPVNASANWRAAELKELQEKIEQSFKAAVAEVAPRNSCSCGPRH